MLDNNQVFILRRSQVHTTEFCLNFLLAWFFLLVVRNNGDLFTHSRVKYFWYKPIHIGYEWTKFGYKRLGTKWPCVLNDWILLQRVNCWVLYSISAPPRIFFLKKHPYSNKQSHSNERPFSVSVIALFEYMYTEINNCSSSFQLFTCRPITKRLTSVSVSELLCPCDCTLPTNVWNVCCDCSYWL